MILDLLRHASTGRHGRLDGRTDPPLVPNAAAAVRHAHRNIHWSCVISSPLVRARDTARALSVDEPCMDAAWSELDFGDWDGHPASGVDAAALAAFHDDPRRHPAPGGEAWDAFEQRIDAGLRALVEQGGQWRGAPVLVVSHAGPLRMALSLACGWPLALTWGVRIDYGTRLRLRVERGDAGRPWGELLELRPA